MRNQPESFFGMRIRHPKLDDRAKSIGATYASEPVPVSPSMNRLPASLEPDHASVHQPTVSSVFEANQTDPWGALSRGLSSGNVDAFAETFEALFPHLVRFALRVTGDRRSAEDVVQDTFLKLWEQRETITFHTSAKSYIFKMVRNGAMNAVRDRRTSAADVYALEEESSGEAGGGESLSALLDAKALARRLHQWIAELPPRQAEAFALSRYHSLSHSEIAQIMGLSTRTVDTHILLALRSLRGRLDTFNSVSE